MKLFKEVIFISILLLITNINVKAETANVSIGYNDINGHVLKEKHDKCEVGEEYTASAITISGYELTTETPKTPTIYCDSEFANNIAFVYQVKGNKKEGSVKAHYLDTKGKKISEPDLRSGTPGVDYYITPKTIDGYTLIKTEGNNNGKFKEGEITIKFIYQKDNEEIEEVKEDVQEVKKDEPKKIVTKKQEVKSSKKKTTTIKTEEIKKEEVHEEVVENKELDDSIVVKAINSIFNRSIITNSKTISNNKFYYRLSFYFLCVINLSLFFIRKSLFK